MTREEAMQRLSDLQDGSGQTYEAIRMAIEALSSAEVQAKCIAEIKVDAEDIYTRITGLVADKVNVVRCKDCRWWNSETKGCKRNPSVEAWYETDFCKYGERQCNYFGERVEECE